MTAWRVGVWTAVLAGSTLAQTPGATGAGDGVLAGAAPADAAVFVGWRGTLDPGPSYVGSKWAAIVKDAQFAKLIDQTVPAAGAALDKRVPDGKGLFADGATVLRAVVRHPSAVFLSLAGDAPHGGLLCRPGTDAAAFTAALTRLAGAVPPELRVRVETQADAVTLAIGPVGDAAAPVTSGTLLASTAYADATRHALPEPFFVAHVDVTAVRQFADAQLKKAHTRPEDLETFERFLDSSGLAGVTSLTAAAGFDGADWRIDSFVAVPSPRKGLLAFDPPPAIDPALLARVPADATSVSMAYLNATGSVAALRATLDGTDPEARANFDKVLGGMTVASGAKIESDLLGSAGPQWVAYTSPDVGGPTLVGTVLVNKLANPAKAKQAMTAVSISASNYARAFLRDKQLSVAGQMTKIGDVNVFYVAAPVVSPAWAIKDGFLYLGLYPQTVAAAAGFAGGSFADNAALAEATKMTGGGAGPLALSYVDVKPMLGQGYGTALAGSRTLLGLSDLFLAATPEPVLPPLAAFRRQAGPVVDAWWADAKGIHGRSRSPFPGAALLAGLGESNSVLTAAPMLMSALAPTLPALNRSREAANRIKSSSNLRQIGLGCKMYANQQGGNKFALPPDLGTVVVNVDITPDVFVNPRVGARGNRPPPPLPPPGTPKDEVAAWVNGHADYVYLGKGKTDDMPADEILAYETPDGLAEGINVLFGDGHVEFVAFPQVEAVFKNGNAPAPAVGPKD